MKFRNYDIDFDIFDADDADAYLKAIEDVRAASMKVPGEPLPDAIRRQCSAVFTFFDDMVGEDIRMEIFGNKVNLMQCIDAFQEFTSAVSAQKSILDKKMATITAASTAEGGNRAERRAQAKASGKRHPRKVIPMGANTDDLA